MVPSPCHRLVTPPAPNRWSGQRASTAAHLRGKSRMLQEGMCILGLRRLRLCLLRAAQGTEEGALLLLAALLLARLANVAELTLRPAPAAPLPHKDAGLALARV